MKKKETTVKNPPKETGKYTAIDKNTIKEVNKIKAIMASLHSKNKNMEGAKIGLFIDILMYDNTTKKPLEGSSLGLNGSIKDEVKYLEAVKAARMLRITEVAAEELLKSIKKRRGSKK